MNIRPFCAALVFLACGLMPVTGASSDGELAELEQKAISAAADRVAPSVVRVETIGGLERAEHGALGSGATTGLVVDKEGFIVSSAFNFLGKPTSILVRLPGGARKPAELVATDHSRMLVVLKIAPDAPLPVPEFAPESEIRVGQWAIAMGRAFESDRPNLAVGVVSARNRVWGKAIQTDAAVSPNNYGGPLVDLLGRVLGLLVPLSPESSEEFAGIQWYDSGIGFAIPAEHLQKTLPRLKKGEDLHPGVIGVTFRDRSLHVGEPVLGPSRPNSPAAKAGLKAGDKIVEIEGRKVLRAAAVKEEVSRRYAGEKMRLVALRDGKRMEHELELVQKLDPYQHPFMGILPRRPAGEDKPDGLDIRYVYPKSPAVDAGVKAGDVLLAVAGKPIKSRAEAIQQLAGSVPDDEVEVEIRRGDQTQKLVNLKLKLAALPEDLPPPDLPPAHGEPKPAEGQRPAVGVVPLKIAEFSNETIAYVPDNYNSAVPYGVVIWLHAPGGFEQDELLARWKPLCDRYELILVAPKSEDRSKWLPGEAALVQRLLADVRRTYTVDPARIVVHGHEGGGALAFLVAARMHQQVSAAAVVDAALFGRMPENEPQHRLAVYLARSVKSPHAASIEQTVTQLRDMKIPLTLKELGEAPRYLNPDELAELVRWIDTLDRL